MKINAKIDGVNWIVNTQPLPWQNKPYIVFGKHPASSQILMCADGVLHILLSPDTALSAAQHAAATQAPGFSACLPWHLRMYEQQPFHPGPRLQARTSRTSRALATPLPA